MARSRIISDNRAAVLSRLRQGARTQVELSTRRTLDGGLARVPIRRGALLRSSRARTVEAGGRIVGVVAFLIYYADFVERGTRKRRAHPYLLPAFLAEVPRYITGMRGLLRR